MADEAVLVTRLEDPVNFTVDESNLLEKGAILKMTDNRVAIINSAAADVVAGINAREKLAGDGRTSTPVFFRGIFRMVASGSITTGDALKVSSIVNRVALATVTMNGSQILGHALADATNGQSLEVLVNVGGGGMQIT